MQGMIYLIVQTWRWLKLFTEGKRVKDKLILFPGAILRFTSYSLGYLRIPWLPQVLSRAAGPIADVTVRNKDGLFYCRRAKDDTTMVAEAFEFPLQSYFGAIKEGIFVDIGANIGKYTIKVGRQMGNKGRVISIEAEPENFEVLKRNIELNKLVNVSAINAACWNEEGELDLYTAPSSKTSGSHSVKEKISPHSVKVKSVKLDNILDSMGIKKVNFIKIDVEGAEVEVLEGAEKIIAKSDSVRILFEVSGEENLGKCQEILKRHKMVIKYIYQKNFLASKEDRE